MSTDRRDFLVHSAGTLGAFALAPEALAARARRSGAPLSIGLIGAGAQGRRILNELPKLEGVRVAALCDPVESRRSSGMRRIQGMNGYATHAEMLDKETLDAVVVATPTHLHAAPAIESLERGKHVYCEAPLAATIDDARKIAAAARGAKGRFMTGMLGRSNPIYALARDFARAGSIRDIVSLRAQAAEKSSWRVPARDPADEAALNWRLDPAVSIGLAGELGVHQLDVFHWFLDGYPSAVSGAGSIQLHKDGRTLADTIACVFEFPGERRLMYEATLANSYEGTHELLRGSMGTFRLAWNAGWMFKEADAQTLGWEVYANREQFHDEQGITLIADATQLASQGRLKEGVGLPEPPLYYGLADFVAACTGQGEVPCTALEGLRATAIAIQADQAVRTGTRLEISPELLADRG